jgi:hypothetical protein
MNGRYRDSTDYHVDMSKKRIYALQKLLECCVHRRGGELIKRMLPVKHEYVLKIRPSEKQIEVYKRNLILIEDEKKSKKLTKVKNNLEDEWKKKLEDKSIDKKASYIHNLKDEERTKILFKHESFFSQLIAHPWIIRQTPTKKSVPIKNDWRGMVPDNCALDYKMSGKFMLFLEILKNTLERGEKLYFF